MPNFKKIFIEKTDKLSLQFFRYFFVGGASTVVDWTALWLLHDKFSFNVYLATAISFGFGLITNYILSELFVFKGSPSHKSRFFGIIVYLATGLVGLLFTESIMYLLLSILNFNYMIAKIIATAVVFVWNFGSKKFILYRKRDI